MTLWRELFDPSAPETPGERLHTKLYELVIVALGITYTWLWAFELSDRHRVIEPQGIGRYLDVSWLFDRRAALANAALMSALALAGLLGARGKLYLLAVASMHLQFAARYSLGKTSHGSHLVGVSLLSFGLCGLLFERRLMRRAAMGLSLLIFGIGYSSAAACKLIATGPRWVDGRNLWLWIEEKQLDYIAQTGSYQLSWLQHLLMQSRVLSSAVLAVGLLTELRAWLMWWKKPRPVVLLAIVAMHVGIELTLDIAFTANIVVLLTLALPVGAWFDRLSARSTFSPGEQ